MNLCDYNENQGWKIKSGYRFVFGSSKDIEKIVFEMETRYWNWVNTAKILKKNDFFDEFLWI